MKRLVVNPIYKDTVTYLETSGETNGRHSLADLTLLPGGKNPPHIHTNFTETFTAVKGELGLFIAGENIILKPGESRTVLRNQAHNFFNPGGDEIKFRIKFVPGHEGMENGIRIGYGLALDGHTTKKGMPKNIMHAAILMEMTNSYPTGIISILKPLLSVLARIGKRKGIEKNLIQKYC